MAYKYKMVRVVCDGMIKYCDKCKDIPVPSEGFCSYCRRPLWRKEGEKCQTIVGYFDGRLKRGENQVGIHYICKECNCVTTI